MPEGGTARHGALNGTWTMRKGKGLQSQKTVLRFEEIILTHLSAAFNLARWLMRNDQDAEDMVQDACVRAYQAFGGFRGGDSRTWLLRIVRNICYTRLQQNSAHQPTVSLDEDLHHLPSDAPGPEAALLRDIDTQMLRQTMDELPDEFREVLVLRELEELSYKEIADIADIPLGTVMSRLARARKRLEHGLRRNEEAYREL
jgi:RNA polymerase sigma factor (sigma-70 family)